MSRAELSPEQRGKSTTAGVDRGSGQDSAVRDWQGTGRGEPWAVQALEQTSPAPGARPPSPKARGWGAPGGCGAPHHQASTGRARVCWGPDSTEQRSGQRPRDGCFRTRELVLGSGHRGADGRGLCHLGGCPGSTGSRGAPRRPRGWQPAHGPPHRPPLPPAWFQEVEHVRKQSPQSLTGHGCAPVPSARRRGAGARPRH